MHFARTEEQDELASTIAALLGKRSDSEAVRTAVQTPDRFDTGLWEALCEQVGVAALAIPEEYDGFGASLVETAVVLEEMGQNLTPAPLLATSVATAALLLFGTNAAKGELLPRLAAGEIGTVALDADPDALVLDAAAATVVLAIDGTDLVLVDAPEADLVDSMDQTLRFGRLSSRTGSVVGTVTDARLLPAISSALATALQVGSMQRALDMTVGYSKERVQFGRQIGSFQALKHRMADMLVKVEASRSASWGATAAAAAYLTDPDAEAADRLLRLSAVAGSYCSDAFDHVAAETIQLHGGIAITWEHDAHLVFKRAHALSHLHGSAHELRATLLD